MILSNQLVKRSVLAMMLCSVQSNNCWLKKNWEHIVAACPSEQMVSKDNCLFLYPCSPEGEGGILFYLCPSVQYIFLGNYQGQKSDILSQASYRYAILWVAFSDPSFLFADLVGIYTHFTYMLIFLEQLIGTPYRGKCFWTHRIPTSCLQTWFLYTLNIYARISLHFSQQILMAEIWYFVTSLI